MPKLEPLPCPFCGKPPVVGPARPDLEGDALGYVRCLNERCPAWTGGPCSVTVYQDHAPIAAAIRRWNKRKG